MRYQDRSKAPWLVGLASLVLAIALHPWCASAETAAEIDLTARIGHTIHATAGDHGTIVPLGEVRVAHGANQSFTITPEEGYKVADVLVDGQSVGAVTEYEFQNVTANHTIHATFAAFDKIGIFRGGIWALDANGNFTWDGTPPDICCGWGEPGDVPVCGDWNGDGYDEIGIYRDGIWALDYNGNARWDGATTDKVYGFGDAGDIPVVGDWDGSGTSKIGIYRSGTWALDYNGNGQWDGITTDKVYGFGNAGDIPVAGDWNGTGTAKMGFVRNVAENIMWVLDYNGNGQWDGIPTDKAFGFGLWGDAAVCGDWNSDGRDKVGIYRGGIWALDYNGNRLWDGIPTDKVYGFGEASDKPVVGKWPEPAKGSE